MFIEICINLKSLISNILKCLVKLKLNSRNVTYFQQKNV